MLQNWNNICRNNFVWINIWTVIIFYFLMLHIIFHIVLFHYVLFIFILLYFIPIYFIDIIFYAQINNSNAEVIDWLKCRFPHSLKPVFMIYFYHLLSFKAATGKLIAFQVLMTINITTKKQNNFSGCFFFSD